MAGAKDAANITVENTATGALIRFQAKGGSPADVEKARQLAQTVSKRLNEGCPMMKDGGTCPMHPGGKGPPPGGPGGGKGPPPGGPGGGKGPPSGGGTGG